MMDKSYLSLCRYPFMDFNERSSFLSKNTDNTDRYKIVDILDIPLLR